MVDIVIPARIDLLVEIASTVRRFLQTLPIIEQHPQLIYNIELAVHEICTNIITHAYEFNNAGSIAINVRFYSLTNQLEINIYDWGKPFYADQRRLPDLEHGQEGGYGLFIVEQVLDSLCYRRTATGNHWQLIKQLGATYEHC
ncbi:ATP-binding protein [Herpetosiphon sp.]|uniref:Anti-sigma regulatory factor, serine/threonine protein kinase n=1 Tax=Herpetosiphon aurantiacus (strain ATCC 23779 / DSM 785 / 114-95) TaxID=316274 RepID=A9AX20_HERA2|nr:ATP-binding protein [Herpetosiphon sp.]ABX04828.1 putative anti-sigma regulatory factor, serine/threonine protein kinase [Herpetosiphon aurantiacus DSM 785]